MPILLKKARETKGWSQSELGRQTGIHPSTISLIESGRLVPYEAQLVKLAKALGLRRIDLSKLVSEEE